jgi:hypothetical protein
LIARQRPGFVGAQDINRGRFIHGREPGWQNALIEAAKQSASQPIKAIIGRPAGKGSDLAAFI